LIVSFAKPSEIVRNRALISNSVTTDAFFMVRILLEK
jgi:hypothetical protein